MLVNQGKLNNIPLNRLSLAHIFHWFIFHAVVTLRLQLHPGFDESEIFGR